MAYSIKEVEGGRIHVVTFHGTVHKEDVHSAFTALSPVGSFQSPRRLWDLREAEFKMTTKDLQELGSSSRGLDAEPARVALLVNRDLVHGMARMYTVYREADSVEMQIFRDWDAALEWLS